MLSPRFSLEFSYVLKFFIECGLYMLLLLFIQAGVVGIANNNKYICDLQPGAKLTSTALVACGHAVLSGNATRLYTSGMRSPLSYLILLYKVVLKFYGMSCFVVAC